MKLTKQQRNTFYNILLVEAEDYSKNLREEYTDVSEPFPRGLCNLIKESIGLYPKTKNDLSNLELMNIMGNTYVCFEETFPELLVQTDSLKFDKEKAYWFPRDIKGWMQRIQLINNAIKATE